MKSDSKKNPAPVAPASTEPTASASAKPRIATALKGTLVKKKGAQAGDPTKMAKPSRSNITATGGARYGIRVKFQKSTAPEAGAVQGNGRIIPSAVKRSAPNFKDGMAE
jgi:hypothetical protein